MSINNCETNKNKNMKFSWGNGSGHNTNCFISFSLLLSLLLYSFAWIIALEWCSREEKLRMKLRNFVAIAVIRQAKLIKCFTPKLCWYYDAGMIYRHATDSCTIKNGASASLGRVSDNPAIVIAPLCWLKTSLIQYLK